MSLNAKARELYGSALSRPKFASFVVILLAVLVFLSTSSIVNNIVAPTSTKGGIPIFLMALAWSGFLSIIPIAILWFLDRREQESKWLYAIALLWGALIATGVAQPINALLINAVKDYFTLHPDIQAFEVEPVITPEEYEAVQDDLIFRTRRISDYDRKISAAIVQAQNELALRKWRLKKLDQDVDTDALVISWREELSRLRGTT